MRINHRPCLIFITHWQRIADAPATHTLWDEILIVVQTHHHWICCSRTHHCRILSFIPHSQQCNFICRSHNNHCWHYQHNQNDPTHTQEKATFLMELLFAMRINHRPCLIFITQWQLIVDEPTKHSSCDNVLIVAQTHHHWICHSQMHHCQILSFIPHSQQCNFKTSELIQKHNWRRG